jgi:hypothetical protein
MNRLVSVTVNDEKPVILDRASHRFVGAGRAWFSRPIAPGWRAGSAGCAADAARPALRRAA